MILLQSHHVSEAQRKLSLHHKDQVEALHDEYLQSLGALSKKSKDCAPFVIIHEQDLQIHTGDTLAAETNRIDRISILRDRQRHSLFKYFLKHMGLRNRNI